MLVVVVEWEGVVVFLKTFRLSEDTAQTKDSITTGGESSRTKSRAASSSIW